MQSSSLPLRFLLCAGIGAAAAAACGSDEGGSGGDARSDATSLPPQPLGAACRDDGDCISRVCLKSQYGTPFCSRACTTAWEPCPAGDDAAAGAALCISFEDPQNPDAPDFAGDLIRFCAPRCGDEDECQDDNPNWETCDVPRWLGDPLFPALGSDRVCQAPSFHGKVPVDPQACDWEKTIDPAYNNEAGLCRTFCDYMDRCKELADDSEVRCCQWGCFNRIVIEGSVQDAWKDEIRCLIETHAAFPDEGPKNACTEPPVECGAPTDPTPPASHEDGR